MALGKQIRRHRLARNLTLEQLSELSDVDLGTISALEMRDSERSKYACQLAQALGLTVEELARDSGTVITLPVAQRSAASYGSEPLAELRHKLSDAAVIIGSNYDLLAPEIQYEVSNVIDRLASEAEATLPDVLLSCVQHFVKK